MKTWNWQRWSVGILLSVAFLLRLPYLNGSLWMDEAAQVLESSRPFNQQLNIALDFQPPQIHYLVHFLLYVSHHEWWLRLGAAVIPGLITVWATYQLGRKLRDHVTGLVAASLLATSSLHIFFSQELRPYSLPTMWAVLSWLIIVNLQDQLPKQKKSLWKWWGAFALVSAAGLYASYLYPFLFVAQVVYLTVTLRKYWRQWAVSIVGTGVLFGVWVPKFLEQLRAGQSLRDNLPGWEGVVSFDQVKSILLVAGKFVYGVMDLDANVFFIVSGGILALCGAGIVFHKKYRQRLFQSPTIRLLMIWLIVPLLTAWLVSFVVPVIQPKRVLYLLPAFYLLVAELTLVAWNNRKKFRTIIEWAPLGLVGALFILNCFSTAAYYFTPQYQREDWRGMYQTIVRRYGTENVIVVFGFYEDFAPWQVYNTQQVPSVNTGVLWTSAVDELPTLKQVTEYDTVLVFDYLRDLTDPERKIEQYLTQYGYQHIDQLTPSTPLGIVHVFKKKSMLFVSQ